MSEEEDREARAPAPGLGETHPGRDLSTHGRGDAGKTMLSVPDGFASIKLFFGFVLGCYSLYNLNL